MTVYATRSGSFTAMQVAQYVPLEYEAVTPVMRFAGEQAKAVLAIV